jgi:restriction system protein
LEPSGNLLLLWIVLVLVFLAQTVKLGRKVVPQVIGLGVVVTVLGGYFLYIHRAAIANFVSVLLIFLGGLSSLVLLARGAELIAAAVKRNRRCPHGMRRGCEECVAEEERRQAEWKASQAVYERKQTIKKEAKALLSAELRALTTKWLSRSELYRQMTPQRFEDSIAVLFRQLGYEVKQTPYSNDRGKDAIAWKGGKKYLIECKHYGADKLIGRRDLQIFVAAMKEENAEAGFYINLGRFAKTAAEYAEQNQIDLYDGERFPILVNAAFPVKEEISTAKAMCLECGVVLTLAIAEAPTSSICDHGHTVINDITVARLLSAPFAPLALSGPPTLSVVICKRCQSKMRVVNGRRGKFWGCSQYPKCKGAKRYEGDF